MRSQTIAFTSSLMGLAHGSIFPKGLSLLSRDFKDPKAPKLDWAPCKIDLGDDLYGNMTEPRDCATLKVPLDYTTYSDDRTIKLQLIRVNATKEPVKGSVLYNPGGPGGSGVERVASEQGTMLRDTLGGHFNVIGFDPRGTGHTIPFTCGLEELSNDTALLRREEHTDTQFDIWNDVLPAQYEAWKLIGDFCFKAHTEEGRFIGTSFVARDMISIVDALGEDGKLRFWGVSYGTVLGQVTASMFPDRVDRMLLDSNLAAKDYISATWLGGSWDTDKSLDKYFADCVEAGPKFCKSANYSGANSTGQSLRKSYDQRLEDLLTNYNETLPDGVEAEGGLTSSAFVNVVKSKVFSNLYRPLLYKYLNGLIYEILEGNWAAIAEYPDQVMDSPWSPPNLAVYGVACSDSTFRAEDIDDLYSATQAHLLEGSFGDFMVTSRLRCSRWPFTAAEKIDANKLESVKTRFPVMFVNSRWDPATSLGSAWEASLHFRGSRVVVHEGVGHGALGHPSNCTNKAISEYFSEGKLPKVGTVCKPNKSSFEHAADLEAKAKKASEDKD